MTNKRKFSTKHWDIFWVVDKECKPCFESMVNSFDEALAYIHTPRAYKLNCGRKDCDLKLFYKRLKVESSGKIFVTYQIFIYKHKVILDLFKSNYPNLGCKPSEDFNKGWVVNGLMYGIPIHEIQRSHDQLIEFKKENNITEEIY